MITMGPLQSDLPSPTAIPKDWELIELDLKDCFYNIFVHETDRPRFAFSVPASNNNKEPFQRCQWRLLLQDMTNSPIMCQCFVQRTIASIGKSFPNVYLIHYMNDVLYFAASSEMLQKVYPCSKKI